MSHVFTPPGPPAFRCAGTAGASFPVHRIYCVGRNYVEHAKEMGFTGREAPFFFMKPADAVLPVPKARRAGCRTRRLTKDLHHEIELVVAIGKGGSIAAADAMRHVWGYAVGLDMTRRDLQGEAKKLGRPWDIGKASTSRRRSGRSVAPPSADRRETAIWLEVNGSCASRARSAS